jgi:ketosteroid isomerase-like protein
LKPRHYRFLLRRGYVAWLAWFADDAELYENIGVINYPPWRPRRKLFRWQMPPRGKKFRQRSGPVLDSIAAVDLFPPERHVVEGDEEEEEEEDDDDC